MTLGSSAAGGGLPRRGGGRRAVAQQRSRNSPSPPAQRRVFFRRACRGPDGVRRQPAGRDNGPTTHASTVRHRRRPGHTGIGVPEARRHAPALPAGERRGRRTAGALFVPRLRRRRRGSHGRRRRERQRRGASRGRRTSTSTWRRCATRWRIAPRPQPDDRPAVRRRAGRRVRLRRRASVRAAAAEHRAAGWRARTRHSSRRRRCWCSTT